MNNCPIRKGQPDLSMKIQRQPAAKYATHLQCDRKWSARATNSKQENTKEIHFDQSHHTNRAVQVFGHYCMNVFSLVCS